MTLAIVVLAVSTGGGAMAAGQPGGGVPVYVAEARLSPNGQDVVFTSGPHEGPNRGKHALLATTFAGGDPRVILPMVASLANLRWSPDGGTIGLISRQLAGGALGTLQIVPASGGEARTMTDVLTDVDAFEWSLDGRRLAYLARTSGATERRLIVTNLAPGAVGTDNFPELIDSAARERVQSFSGGVTTLYTAWVGPGQRSVTLSNGRETWIDLVTAATGATVTVMRPGIANIQGPPTWSSDGTRFVVVGSTATHQAEVFAGTLPLVPTGRPPGGAPPPTVRRITFSNP